MKKRDLIQKAKVNRKAFYIGIAALAVLMVMAAAATTLDFMRYSTPEKAYCAYYFSDRTYATVELNELTCVIGKPDRNTIVAVIERDYNGYYVSAELEKTVMRGEESNGSFLCFRYSYEKGMSEIIIVSKRNDKTMPKDTIGSNFELIFEDSDDPRFSSIYYFMTIADVDADGYALL